MACEKRHEQIAIPIWPWFESASPHFDREKLTRTPNQCPWCREPMMDCGEMQIIYVCVARSHGPKWARDRKAEGIRLLRNSEAK